MLQHSVGRGVDSRGSMQWADTATSSHMRQHGDMHSMTMTLESHWAEA